jgi:hypothetical protein
MRLEAQASSSSTSDAAEFEALIAGLKTAIKHGIKHILACGHSQVYQHVRLHFMNCLKHFHELETLQNHNPSFKTPMIWRQNDAQMVIDLSGLYLKMNQTNYRYVLCLLQSFKVSSVLFVVVLQLKLKITH